MYAVIESGGKQYHVTQGEAVKLEKLEGEVGDPLSFDRILLASDGESVHVGKPYLESCKVTGRIARQAKDRKVLVFKYRRRKGYQKKRGHRQPFTLVSIDNIEF